MDEKTKALVVRALRYKDEALIVDLYTESRGLVAFWVKMPKSHRAAMRSVLFRPLTILEIDFDYRPKVNLQRLKDVRIMEPFTSIPYHPIKQAVALFLSEFLGKVLKADGADHNLYAFMVYSLQWLDRVNEGFANFHLVFVTRLTRFLGIYPNVEHWHQGDYFDLQAACFVNECPLHRWTVQPEYAAFIPLFMRMNYANMRFFLMNGVQRNHCLELLNTYYRLHVPDFPELKSLEVLREVFA